MTWARAVALLGLGALVRTLAELGTQFVLNHPIASKEHR